MNALQKLQSTAGQKVHERLFGATLTIFGKEIPCAHSKLETDFDLVPGGRSPKTFIASLTFRVELTGNSLPQKGTACLLNTAGGKPLALQLWSGGPVPGRGIYEFMAVDANYKA